MVRESAGKQAVWLLGILRKNRNRKAKVNAHQDKESLKVNVPKGIKKSETDSHRTDIFLTIQR
jgi:hypothetical protein